MQRAMALFVAAGTLLATNIPAGLAAQTVRTQDLTFGGGSHFDFAVPVSWAGRISIEVTMPAGVPVEAMLFSPREHDYTARARGVGSLLLAHNIVMPADDAGEWRLDVVLPSEYGTSVGTVRVTWPASTRGDESVLWLNAGPTNPDDLAAIADGLTSLPAPATHTNGGTVLDADVLRIAGVVRTRLDVLAGTPARYVRNDYAVDQVNGATLSLPAANGAASVSLVEFAAYQQGPWHPGRSSDRSYVVAALVPEAGGVAVGGQSKLYQFQCSDPYSHRTKPVKITHETGEALLLPDDGSLPNGELVVAVLEREHAQNGTSLHEFLHGAELFATYRAVAGPDAVRHLPWLLDLALGRGDGVVGTPRLITIDRTLTADTLVDREIRFVQDNAEYGVKIRVVAANARK